MSLPFVALLLPLALGAAPPVSVTPTDASPVQHAAPDELPRAMRCARFPEASSTAFNQDAGRITLPWRTDFPSTPPKSGHAWEPIDFREDWRGYIEAILGEVEASGLKIMDGRVTMAPDAPWWISPWMDYGPNGREALIGLTKERGPDPGDLSPTSGKGPQVWAIGFYNREGAGALGDVFADPCNPSRPAAGWAFPDGTASFKLLFTDADPAQVHYLEGAPEVVALVDPPGTSSSPSPLSQRKLRRLRLIQVDVAVRDADAPLGWVFGTFIWKRTAGEGLFDNLVPVGLSWGNDPGVVADPLEAFAPLEATRLNADLAGIVWQGTAPWKERPWPGFQGRLNGPADNLRSSCMSCHALAQWPRSKNLSILPSPSSRFSLTALGDRERRKELVANWMRDVPGGTLTNPAEAAAGQQAGRPWGGATPLDYSLQIEAAFTRMCEACASGDMQGATPEVCKVEGIRTKISSPTCKAPGLLQKIFGRSVIAESKPPRQ